MPDSQPEPDDLIDPEVPAGEDGRRVDTQAYAGRAEAEAAPDLAHPGAGDISDVEAPRMGEGASEPPPAPPRALGGDDPYAGEAMEAPPHAGPELGGGPAVGGAAAVGGDALEAAAETLLDLCADRPWGDVSLRDVAARAGVSFAALYARAPGKAALLSRLSDRYDREALRAMDGDPQPQAHDRLFEGFMARLDVLSPRRDVLIAIGRAEPLLVARRLPRTARALAEAAGVDTSGPRGALRVAALTGVWARTLQVWRDDEGALNRTMAEIDKRLRQAARRLERVGAGF